MRKPTPSRRRAGEEATPVAPVQALPLVANHLRKLARRVERIGAGRDPEQIVSDKLEISAVLEKLASLLDGGSR
ncbi:MAG: hypothetical protein Q8N31_01530 [Reyranella sp.]|nr:hypothetical protein [Reyranella sp.]